MKSWKTTLAGCVGAVGTYLTTQEGTLHTVGVALMGLSSFLVGFFARDNNVTSEKAGAK